MIDKNNLKIYSYEELKPFLPKDSILANLYEKAKDKTKFDVFFVYEGSIETDTLDLSTDIFWATYYKFVAEQSLSSFFGPIILGNINCKTLNFYEGLIIGDVNTKNMSIQYSDRVNSFSEITGSLNVKELLFATGKGIWGKKFALKVGKDATVNTFINNEQASIKADNLTINKSFDFPQIYETEDRDITTTDWSKYTLDELTTHFNSEHLKLDEYGKTVSFFFQEPTKLCKAYFNYINE